MSDFGFPTCFTSFNTGQQVGCSTPPLTAFTPVDDANGVTQYSEGLSAMACVQAGQMWFVGSGGGCFLGFHGTKNGTGAGNPDNALLYYDFASGVYTPILDDGTDNVGHWDTLAVSGDTLIVGDMGVNGWVDYNYGNSGYLAEFTLDASTQTPEPHELGYGGWRAFSGALGKQAKVGGMRRLLAVNRPLVRGRWLG